MERYPFAVVASVAAVPLLCLYGAFASLTFESAYQQQSPDPYKVAQQVKRFEQVAAIVPKDAELGYVTDAQTGSVIESAMFLGAQYALAPRLLMKDPAKATQVLGNFSRPGDFAAFGSSRGLRIQQDFGHGVVLFVKAQ
jgi:hypothetical protein